MSTNLASLAGSVRSFTSAVVYREPMMLRWSSLAFFTAAAFLSAAALFFSAAARFLAAFSLTASVKAAFSSASVRDGRFSLRSARSAWLARRAPAPMLADPDGATVGGTVTADGELAGRASSELLGH